MEAEALPKNFTRYIRLTDVLAQGTCFTHALIFQERQRWIAELDLDPNMSRNISVCSLHFKEGEPTEASPFPTEWLQSMKDPSKFHEKTSFSGKKLKTITEETKDEVC